MAFDVAGRDKTIVSDPELRSQLPAWLRGTDYCAATRGDGWRTRTSFQSFSTAFRALDGGRFTQDRKDTRFRYRHADPP